MTTAKDVQISKDITKLAIMADRAEKPITVTFQGVEYTLNTAFVSQLRRANDLFLSKKSSSRKKALTDEEIGNIRAEVIPSIMKRVEASMNTEALKKVSDSMKRFALRSVENLLQSDAAKVKSGKFSTNNYSVLDDHFVEFLKSGRFHFLMNPLKTESDTALVKEAQTLGKTFIDYLVQNRVVCSTVMITMMSLYINSNDLAISGPNQEIKIDGHLGRLLDSPMDSLFNGKKATFTHTDFKPKSIPVYDENGKKVKEVVDGKTVDKMIEIPKISDVRHSKPERSVRDYITKYYPHKITATTLSRDNLMSIISGHLMSTSDLDITLEEHDKRTAAVTAIQAVASASLSKTVATPRNAARSPARSPRRGTSPGRGSPTRGSSPKRGSSPRRGSSPVKGRSIKR